MSTNYELVWNDPIICPNCKCEIQNDQQRVHFGKSSGGWAFTLRQDNDLGLYDWPDWKRYAERHHGVFEDEEGAELTPNQMEAVVFREGCIDVGLLMRHKPDGGFCLANHPTKPIDYVQGEFS